ncbi:hypothetical protein HBN50_10125 [Halobacteriovorax sp. GB3]|uniref:hypothetical protein n=1 Tax=Halobacteriovorax sp. GB3 TaxID=2719615 RepID=UPI00235E81E7|nr:hypothetical protein [Halobacteriovorax sp. GB3]MDD0853457.1 hypothetical protein [Halobacteriovorax sp. GB3]
MKKKMKRCNVIIPEDYHEAISKRGLKLSGVIREALEDQLNPNTITLSVSEEVHSIYMELFNDARADDKDFEPYLKRALKEYVNDLLERQNEKLLKLKNKLT